MILGDVKSREGAWLARRRGDGDENGDENGRLQQRI